MTTDESWRKFWVNAVPQYGVTFAQYLVPLLTLPYLTRVLGAEVYGQVVLLTAFTSYFQLLIEFGFNFSASADASVSRADTFRLAILRSGVQKARFALAFIGIVVYLLILLTTSFASGYRDLAIAYLVSAALTAMLPIYMFRGLEVMPSLSAILITARLLFALLVFTLVQSPDDVLWVPLANILGSVVVHAYSYWYLTIKQRIPRAHSNLATSLELTRTSLPYFVDAVSSTAFSAFTVLFISVSGLSLREIAVWGAAYQIIAAAQSMYTPIIATLLPRMARSFDWGFIRTLVGWLGPAVSLGCILLFLGADLVMGTLYGSEFAYSGAILRALVPVLALSFPALLLGAPVLGTTGRQAKIASSTLTAGVVYLVGLASLWALDDVSLIGIALLRCAGELLLLLIRVWHLKPAS